TGHESDESRLDLLRGAASELEAIGDLLQDLQDVPAKDARKEKARRVIVLPGVFDLGWRKGTTKHTECRNSWNRQMERFHFTTAIGAVLRFDKTPLGEIVFLPFDSLSVDAIMERLGPQAVDDIMDIRRALQLKCRRPMLEWLQEPGLNENGELEVRA